MKFFTTAVFDKLAVTASYYAKHIGKPNEVFSRELLELILEMLRPEN